LSDVNHSLADSRDALDQLTAAGVPDYARFQAPHTRHHTKQITGQ
jgi:hypothetical protein